MTDHLPSDTELQVAHTSELGPATLSTVRAFLDQVFGAASTDDAWDHALGGMHALIWESGQLIAHGSVIQRRLIHGGRTLRTGYLESVAVRADRRRSGYGAAVMEPLERIIRAAYELGALAASEAGAPFYAARGWKQWRGPIWALTPSGPLRTAQGDGDVYVLEVGVRLDLRADLTCNWREGDVW